MGSLSLPCLCRGRWPEVFNVTFCFVKINPWICFTSIVHDFYILIFKTHHPLFECDQDWVLRDHDQILACQESPSPLWVPSRLSTLRPSKTKTKTKTQWPRTNIRYVRTHHPLFECHQDWVLRDNCKLHDGFLAEVLVRPKQTLSFSQQRKKNDILNSQKRRRNKITWEAEHYDHFHQASGWLHTWEDGHLWFQQTTRMINASMIG